MAKSNRVRIAELVDHFATQLKTAFLDAVANISANADLGRIVRALEANDLNAAMDALHLDPAAFRPLDLALATAFEGGGTAAVAGMPFMRDDKGNRVVFRFDARNPRAEAFLRDFSSEKVTAIIDDQRLAIRNALEAGMAAGQNPRTVALDIVGRIDKATGRRSGGIVGLTSTQEAFAQNYRAELLSGDPSTMANALRRTLRDRRLDGRVRAAMEAGKPVDAATVETLVTRYRNSLLRLRGETIGRTEALTALHVAQDEAYQQAIDKGDVKRSMVKKVWSATGDSRVRHTHRALDGQRVGLDDMFVSVSGATLRFPGDPNAPADEIIGCRCAVEYDIDFLAGAREPAPKPVNKAPRAPTPDDIMARVATVPTAPLHLYTPEAVAERQGDIRQVAKRAKQADERELEILVVKLYGFMPGDETLAGLYGSRLAVAASRRAILQNAVTQRLDMIAGALARAVPQ